MKIIFFIFSLVSSLAAAAAKDDCVKDQYYNVTTVNESFMKLGQERSANETTFTQNPDKMKEYSGLQNESSKLNKDLCKNNDSWKKLIAKAQSAAKSEELVNALVEIRQVHACGPEQVDLGHNKWDYVDHFVDGQVKKFHNACTVFWRNQIICIWNITHDAKNKRKFLSGEAPSDKCPKL